jgi:hypothetical protein
MAYRLVTIQVELAAGVGANSLGPFVTVSLLGVLLLAGVAAVLWSSRRLDTRQLARDREDGARRRRLTAGRDANH